MNGLRFNITSDPDRMTWTVTQVKFDRVVREVKPDSDTSTSDRVT